ncbi:hypothetical protein EC973_007374 [Apophysomyces ossiformis]|uniref:Uncharacterized protein n=1 Tax=Apophysomyces ossiformis TaxID=679940 RepID=A0A8H7BUV1_9FUNG|nr:hypothetical protein EC973_007374 [Apophysomyces ossiformis]
MKKAPQVFWAIGLLCLLLSVGAESFTHSKYRTTKNRLHARGQYVVEFGYDAPIDSSAFLSDLENQVPGIKLLKRYAFTHELFRGVSFEARGLEESKKNELLKAIVDKEYVARVYPNTRSVHPEAEPMGINNQVSPETVRTLLPHNLTQVDRVHEELKLTGKGVLICILDSGIDYNHPALGGGFGQNFKVVTGADRADKKDTPLDDCPLGSKGGSGHGTHVAGIAAGYDASKSFVGVAPDASIGFWKVFSCEGGGDDDGFLQSLTEAYDSKCEVINLSLGQTNQLWSESAQSVVIEKLVEKGIPVVVSASNDGAYGAFSVASPAAAKNALSVASVDNAHYLTRLFEAKSGSNLDQKLGPYSYNPEPSAFDLIPNGQVVLGYNPKDENVCSNQTDYSHVRGNLVLLKLAPGCDPSEQVATVANSGAIGALFAAPDETARTPDVALSAIPVVGISKVAGNDLEAALQKNEAITLHFSRESFAQKLSTGGFVSEFSSIGPNADLDLHPRISGPGGTIFSSLPRYLGAWGMMSGTSMSAPYVTGSVALFIQSWKAKNQQVNPQFIFEHFQNYAAIGNAGPLHKDLIDNPIRQGAGLVQVYDAIQETVHISPAQISFNDTASVQEYKVHTLNITNFGTERASYRLRNKIATAIKPYTISKGSLTMTRPADYFAKSDANVTFMPSDLTIEPGQTQQVTVRVDIPLNQVNSTEHLIYGGYVQFESQQGNRKGMSVPYFGIWGKQRDLPLLSQNETAIISMQEKMAYAKNETYAMSLKNPLTYPAVLAYLYTPSAKVTWDLLDEHMQVLGRFKESIYVDRTLTDDTLAIANFTGNYTVETGGQPESRNAAVGQYKFKVSALKLFGNPQDVNDWETWVSGPVQVQL